MKKTINIHCDVDASGRLFYRLTKQKGRLSLDEITEAMSEYEIGWYAVIIHCTDDGYQGFMDGEKEGDAVELYPADEFLEDA